VIDEEVDVGDVQVVVAVGPRDVLVDLCDHDLGDRGHAPLVPHGDPEAAESALIRRRDLDEVEVDWVLTSQVGERSQRWHHGTRVDVDPARIERLPGYRRRIADHHLEVVLPALVVPAEVVRRRERVDVHAAQLVLAGGECEGEAR
jgi:hypothetical protein